MGIDSKRADVGTICTKSNLDGTFSQVSWDLVFDRSVIFQHVLVVVETQLRLFPSFQAKPSMFNGFKPGGLKLKHHVKVFYYHLINSYMMLHGEKHHV